MPGIALYQASAATALPLYGYAVNAAFPILFAGM
jgi:hypothetical protein